MARKKQTELPGMERKTIREVNDAAEAYVDARDERMTLTKKEVAAKEALIGAMQKHELNVYRDDTASPPLVVTLVEGKVNVKVALSDDGEPTEPKHEGKAA
jgi:hypothetical protein